MWSWKGWSWQTGEDVSLELLSASWVNVVPKRSRSFSVASSFFLFKGSLKQMECYLPLTPIVVLDLYYSYSPLLDFGACSEHSWSKPQSTFQRADAWQLFFCGVHPLVSLYPSHPIPLSSIVNKVHVTIAWTTPCGVGLMAELSPAMGAVFCLDAYPAGYSGGPRQPRHPPSIHCTVWCSC